MTRNDLGSIFGPLANFGKLPSHPHALDTVSRRSLHSPSSARLAGAEAHSED